MNFFTKTQRMGVAAVLLAASSLLSRLMGLIRDKVISWQFGAGSEADLYFAAFVVPDMINYLLAGGFLSITMIPLLSRAFQEDEEKAWAFFSAVFTLMLTASLLLTVLCMLLAKPLAAIIAPGFTPAQLERLAFFMRIILPAQIFFLSGACCTALLFMRRQFRVPALTPLIYNASIILGGVLLPALATLILPGATYASMLQRLGMTGYCVGVTVGAFLGAFLLPFCAARKEKLHLRLCFGHPLLGRFLRIALPLMLGQTIIMLDEQFLRIFGSLLSTGTVSLLNYARRIAQVPTGLVGQAAAVAAYPFLVELLTQGKTEDFAKRLRTAFQGGFCVLIPCVAWMCTACAPIITLLFYGGRFGMPETLACVPLTQIMLLAVPFWMLYMILVRGFYAYQDTLTPALTGTLMTILVIPVYAFVAAPRSAEAIAITSCVSVSLYVCWLIVLWIRRFGYTAFTGIVQLLLRLTLAVLPATLASALTVQLLTNHLLLHPLLVALISLSVSGLLFLICLIPLLLRLVPEFQTLLGPRLQKLVKKIVPTHGERNA